MESTRECLVLSLLKTKYNLKLRIIQPKMSKKNYCNDFLYIFFTSCYPCKTDTQTCNDFFHIT